MLSEPAWAALGVLLIVAVICALDWRRGVRMRKSGWFLDCGLGRLGRAGWRWQDRRMRRSR